MSRDPFTELRARRIEPSEIQSHTRALWSRAQIVARAHWRCQACDRPTHRLEVHHIRKRAACTLGPRAHADPLVAWSCDRLASGRVPPMPA
jgi:hypothetical protein